VTPELLARIYHGAFWSALVGIRRTIRWDNLQRNEQEAITTGIRAVLAEIERNKP